MPLNMPVVTKKAEWAMPRPPAIVTWTNAPGGTVSYAVVTSYGRHAVDLMLFPPDSRIGIPKSGVRFVGDPWNTQNGINADAGVWDYTDESKALRILVDRLVSNGDIEPNEDEARLFGRMAK